MYMYNMPGVSDYVMAANTFLSERFLFGTAYPFIGFREGVEQFKALPFKPEVLPNLLYRNAIKALKLDIRAGNNPPAGRFQPLLRASRRTHAPPYSRKSRRRKAFPPEGFAAPSRPAVAAFTEALCPPIHPKP